MGHLVIWLSHVWFRLLKLLSLNSNQYLCLSYVVVYFGHICHNPIHYHRFGAFRFLALAELDPNLESRLLVCYLFSSLCPSSSRSPPLSSSWVCGLVWGIRSAGLHLHHTHTPPPPPPYSKYGTHTPAQRPLPQRWEHGLQSVLPQPINPSKILN